MTNGGLITVIIFCEGDFGKVHFAFLHSHFIAENRNRFFQPTFIIENIYESPLNNRQIVAQMQL